VHVLAAVATSQPKRRGAYKFGPSSDSGTQSPLTLSRCAQLRVDVGALTLTVQHSEPVVQQHGRVSFDVCQRIDSFEEADEDVDQESSSESNADADNADVMTMPMLNARKFSD
jgi:hypothetical protein